MAKKKAKSTKQDDDVVYDDTEDDDDWVEDEKAATEPDKGKDKNKPAEEKPVESIAQMPDNKPGKPPPRPDDQKIPETTRKED